MASPFTVTLCTTPDDLQRCLDIRVQVFVTEQGFTIEDELDEKDPTSDHFLLYHLGLPIGTIRYWIPPSPSSSAPYGKLGRLAVLKTCRGTGAGKFLVQALETHLLAGEGRAGREQGGKEVVVVANSQMYAENFYAKLGWTRDGEPHIEDGEPHIRMVKTVRVGGVEKP